MCCVYMVSQRVPRSCQRRQAPIRSALTALQSLLVAATIVVTLVFTLGHFGEPFVDFHAFYCAGAALDAGADPYREHPLHECEAALSIATIHATVPAPFPGFVLALFGLLARLPFASALLCWELAAILALAFTVVLAARLTKASLTASAITLGFPGVMLALTVGQLTTFVVLAVIASAALLQSRRPRAAGVVALAALLDPHVGLALIVALFVGSRQSRGILLVGVGILGAVGFTVSGATNEWEYLRSVLPAHALANLADATNFGVSTLLFEANLPAALALAVGSLWYLAAVVIGVVVALRLQGGLGPCALALIPPALAVFGGTYIHTQQLAVAIPAFMLLAATADRRLQAASCCAVFVAAMPWIYLTPYCALYLFVIVLAIIYVRESRCANQGLRLAIFSGACLAAGILTLLAHHARDISPIIVAGNPLAEVSWQAFTLAWNVPIQPWYVIARMPTTLAFVFLVWMLMYRARPSLGSSKITSHALVA